MPSFEILPDIFTRLSVVRVPKARHVTSKLIRISKVFDEPLGESNTERRVKISAGASKEGT